jgi:hypothetical protein
MIDRPQGQDARMPQQGPEYLAQQGRRSTYQRQSMEETVIKSFIRSIASSLGRAIVRAIRQRLR